MASFEKQLKQRLANASKPAPATDGDWERLQAALAANAPKKKRAVWWIWGTAAVGVVGLGLGVWLFDYTQSDISLGSGVGSSEREDWRWKMGAGSELSSALADGRKEVSMNPDNYREGRWEMEVGSEKLEAANQLPSALADGRKEGSRDPDSYREEAGSGKKALPPSGVGGSDDNKSQTENNQDVLKAGEMLEPETPPATPKTPPNLPQIKLPKTPNLPIRAGIETTLMGSKQNAKGGNAAFTQIRKDGDKRTAGFSTQLTLELGTNPDSYRDYKLATGIGFQQQNFQGNYIYPYKWVDSFPVYVGGVIVGWGKNPPRDTTLNYSLSSSVKTVYIPVKIRFSQKLGDNWGALVETGMQYGFVTGAGGQIISPDKNLPNIIDLQMLRRHTFTLSLGLGGYYDANRWLRLYLQTWYGRQLTSIFKQYNTTSNSLNLTLGCQFKL